MNLWLGCDDADSQLWTDGLVPVQNVNPARNLVVHNVVLASNTHREAVHGLTSAPGAELGHVNKVRSDERKRFLVEQDGLLVQRRGTAADLHHCSGVRRVAGNVLGRSAD